MTTDERLDALIGLVKELTEGLKEIIVDFEERIEILEANVLTEEE